MVEIPPIHPYWERPAPKEQGEADDTMMYLCVGCALTEWERTESKFADIFAFFLQGEHRAAHRVYGTLVSGSARSDAISAAAEVFFPLRRVIEKDQASLSLLLKHIRKGAERRNDIAHAVVTQYYINNNQRGFFLVPPDYATRKNKLTSQPHETETMDIFPMVYRFTADDIKLFMDKFKELGRWAYEYHQHLMALYSPR